MLLCVLGDAATFGRPFDSPQSLQDGRISFPFSPCLASDVGVRTLGCSDVSEIEKINKNFFAIEGHLIKSW
jgi:hypothetical protein